MVKLRFYANPYEFTSGEGYAELLTIHYKQTHSTPRNVFQFDVYFSRFANFEPETTQYAL